MHSEDALITCAHALDARDYARLRECLAADVRVKYGASPWLEGIEAVARFCARSLDPLDATRHRVGSVDVKLERSRAFGLSALRRAPAERQALHAGRGRNLDRWIRTPAGWRIAQRELAILWTDGDPSVLARPERP